MRSATSSGAGSPRARRLNRCTQRAIAAALLFMAASLPAQAPAQTPALAHGLWPSVDGYADNRGLAVTLESASPFGLSDFGAKAGGPTRVPATLFLPADWKNGGRVPAVVLLHGAAGVLYQREMTYARQFAAMGVAALVIDVFGARRDRASGFIERLLEITETMMIADAYSGLRFLGRHEAVDPRRVALMGFSYGGMASVLAAYAQVAETIAPDGLRFAAHVAFYGPCLARFEDPRATGAPVLMVWGSEDALIDPDRCAEIAEDLRKGGAPVSTVAYDGAYHQWDGAWEGPFEIGRSLADCRFRVSRNGIARDRLTWLPMTDPWLRRIILGLCVAGDGYMIGRDDKVRARSNRDVGRFLATAFMRKGRGDG